MVLQPGLIPVNSPITARVFARFIKVHGLAEYGDDAIPGGVVDPDVLYILHLAEVQVYVTDADDVQRLAWRGIKLT